MVLFIGMHNIIGMLLVSADIGFKINGQHADIRRYRVTNKIIGCCFLD